MPSRNLGSIAVKNFKNFSSKESFFIFYPALRYKQPAAHYKHLAPRYCGERQLAALADSWGLINYSSSTSAKPIKRDDKESVASDPPTTFKEFTERICCIWKCFFDEDEASDVFMSLLDQIMWLESLAFLTLVVSSCMLQSFIIICIWLF
ncbi:hypothetical protein F2Q70_00003625 [Brassica cretica]|uniref:Uncharacterized protein n=1 Tax=Brassica cretica TaxID=69181 RepID=A0A3N6QA15_BRACR|nr:hypothetical protein F2Q70_00003625 [Brassica cretica]